jgi:hypothetical protein
MLEVHVVKEYPEAIGSSVEQCLLYMRKCIRTSSTGL